MSLSTDEMLSVLTATDCLKKIYQFQDLLKVVIEVSDTYTLENCQRIQLLSQLYLVTTEPHFEELETQLRRLRENESE